MSETQPEAPAMPKPDAADRKPRAITAPVTNPEAPYGYMTDPKTGETRPKKRPGRQSATGKSEPPPRQRPANEARQAIPGSTAKKTTQQTAKEVNELLQGVWLLLAAVPEADAKIPGTKHTIKALSIRTRAQASILEDNSEGVTKGLVIMSQHSKPVAKFLARAGDESGPAWILPAMMAMMPFAVQSAAMWNAPAAGDVEKLAKRASDTLDAMLHPSQPEASQDGNNPGGSGA
jgi:hypothetical protein